jgi:RNA polymerase sigma-70 factor (ECF subfamily)
MPDSSTNRFDTLVAPHLGMLLRVAYRLVRNTSDAQDLVQDTCIAACENPAGIGAAEHPVRWLLNVLNRRFIDRHRRQKRASLIGLEEANSSAPLVCEQPGPEESLLRSDSEGALVRAYLRLEDAQRTLLVLRAEGHDLAEIEQITGLPKEVLRARLHRARRSLARYMEEQSGATPIPLRIGSNQ